MLDEPNVPGVLVVAFLQTVIEVNVVLVVRCVWIVCTRQVNSIICVLCVNSA